MVQERQALIKYTKGYTISSLIVSALKGGSSVC